MRRYRRLVLIDRVIPFLAALVGLVALGGAVLVQLSADQRTAAVTTELASIRSSLDALAKRADGLSVTRDDGTAEGLLALQDRMNRLESDWTAKQAELAAVPATPRPSADQPAEAASVSDSAAEGPTTDCIPLGTRFMVTPNETYPLCRSTAVVKVGAITADTIDIEGAGTLVETGFGTLVGTKCTVMVFQADEAGFGEVRVTCT